MAQPKAPDMTEEEILTLIHEYGCRKDVIESEDKSADFGRRRNRAWEEVKQAVNACGAYKRTTEQIKIKLKNFKTKTKAKHLSNKRLSNKTGGGPAPKPLTTAEEKLVALLENTAGWKGVPGGAPSSSISPFSSPSRIASGDAALAQVNASETDELRRPPNDDDADSDQQDTSLRRIRKLQIRALETQIKANESVTATCSNINNILIPNILANFGCHPDILKTLK